jgi:hypothetical protein
VGCPKGLGAPPVRLRRIDPAPLLFVKDPDPIGAGGRGDKEAWKVKPLEGLAKELGVEL